MKAGTADAFAYAQGELHCEQVAVSDIARRFGTPTYIYSRRAIEDAYRRYAGALAGRSAVVCYATKANANLAVLGVLARLGSGFDIVSGGELARVLAAGASPERIVFSGVGKSREEIEAGLRARIGCFNVESDGELEAIDALAQSMGTRAPVSIRINPDVDAGTHEYISTGLKQNKFGVSSALAEDLYRRAATMRGVRIVGIDCHIGSQIANIAPYVDAAERVLDLVDRLATRGIALTHIDLGGGLGIVYRVDDARGHPGIEELIRALLACVDRRGHGEKTLIVEPGRSIVGGAGILLTRVQYLKANETRRFAIVDAAMNDLLRPALYGAWMEVVPVRPREGALETFDVVGPVCESGDWLARERSLALAPGDLLAIRSAGAYGMSMASNYNSRGRPAEVMVDGATVHLARRRETPADLMNGESLLPE